MTPSKSIFYLHFIWFLLWVPDVSGATTPGSIQREGYACFDMAAAFPALQSLTGGKITGKGNESSLSPSRTTILLL